MSRSGCGNCSQRKGCRNWAMEREERTVLRLGEACVPVGVVLVIGFVLLLLLLLLVLLLLDDMVTGMGLVGVVGVVGDGDVVNTRAPWLWRVR